MNKKFLISIAAGFITFSAASSIDAALACVLENIIEPYGQGRSTQILDAKAETMFKTNILYEGKFYRCFFTSPDATCRARPFRTGTAGFRVYQASSSTPGVLQYCKLPEEHEIVRKLESISGYLSDTGDTNQAQSYVESTLGI